MGWTLGMTMHLSELEQRSEGKTGLDYIRARIDALNHLYCWCKDTKESRWPMANRHLWRIRAMYFGGDCYIAGWPGAAPHQKIWHYRQPTPPRTTKQEWFDAELPVRPFSSSLPIETETHADK